MAELHDPALPPGAIVATHKEDESLEEGQVRRNDGVVLNPAWKNPWYVLATVAGEQEGTSRFVVDGELHSRNRRFWNGWMCQHLSSQERYCIAEKLNVPCDELEPLTSDEKRMMAKKFAEIFRGAPEDQHLPDPSSDVNMLGIHFSKVFAVGKFFFPGHACFIFSSFAKPADFKTAVFHGCATFEAAHFDRDTDFKSTSFCNDADFETVYFAGPADFTLAKFADDADFKNAIFVEYASFERADFGALAIFQTANFEKCADFIASRFEGYVTFATAVFSGPAYFSNGECKSETIFGQAKFEHWVPEFFHRDMHQDTSFSDNPKLWPYAGKDNAEDGKRAYTRLRQVAAEVYDPDLEHFFLRQEMRCKEQIERDKGAWFHAWVFVAYRVIADSGISVARPSVALALLVAVPWGIIGSWLRANGSETPIAEGFGVSVGNTLPFLGLVRKMHPDYYEDAPWWLDALSGAQSLFGIVLLFFFGLGLRNRFRLK